MTLLEHATNFQEMASGPDLMEAVDTYYAEDITIVEVNGDTFEGRTVQKQRIQEWLDSIEEIHESGVRAIAANEETGHVFVESFFEATFKEGGRMQMEEVAVQRWEGDKVVHEKFYYDMPAL